MGTGKSRPKKANEREIFVSKDPSLPVITTAPVEEKTKEIPPNDTTLSPLTIPKKKSKQEESKANFDGNSASR